MSTSLFSHHPRNDMYLLICIAFGIAFFLCLFLLIRSISASKKFTAWIALSVFCALRVAGSAICLSVSQTALNNQKPSASLATAGYVILGLSLSPLELSAMHLLISGCVDGPEGRLLNRRHASIGRLLIIAAMVLAIYGFTVQESSFGSGSSNTTGLILIKVSGIIFMVALAYIVLLAVVCYRNLGTRYHSAASAYVYGVLLASPFFVVTIVYFIISAFTMTGNLLAQHAFSIFNGDWKIFLGMEIITEIIITVIFITSGFSVISRDRKAPDTNYPAV